MQPFDETKLTEVQRKQFELMSEREKDLVCKGHLVKVISLESEEEICSFNEDTYEISKSALESFVRAVLPDIVEYYNNKREDFTEK